MFFKWHFVLQLFWPKCHVHFWLDALPAWCINFLHDDVLQWGWRQGWEPAFRPERYVTQYPVLFSHLNTAQTLACKRARENHEKSERLSPFLQLVRSNLMLFPIKCCPQSDIFPPLNSVCMSYLFLSYLELICCNIKQSNPILQGYDDDVSLTDTISFLLNFAHRLNLLTKKTFRQPAVPPSSGIETPKLVDL